MRKLLSLALFTFFFGTGAFAQDNKAAGQKHFMQITTVESVIGGGMGRSKMIITKEDGTQTETDLNNLFSMAGINFGNIKENESKVINTLKQYTNEGWKIDQVVPLSLSPSNNSMGIFMTRYLLTKEESKKTM